jgi:hypothetical protein
MDLSLIIGIISVTAAVITLYYSRKQTIVTVNQASATDKSISITQENQITESFTRAIAQLGAVDKDGNPAIEIRLGAISSLEMIANKSDEYYWPIMETLTAYLRKNSHIEYGERTFHFEYSKAQKESIEVEDIKTQAKVSLDIHAIVTVIRRRRYFLDSGEADHLDLRGTNLREANFQGANLQEIDLNRLYQNLFEFYNWVISHFSFYFCFILTKRVQFSQINIAYLLSCCNSPFIPAFISSSSYHL